MPSPTPTEVVLPGDANGDGLVNEIDVDWLGCEIFDGDGDLASQVRNAGLLSAPGVDANGDTKVTAADFIGIALH